MRSGSAALATERVERRLAAILAADVTGYSRLMGLDEEDTHERLKAHRRELTDPKIRDHYGRTVKNTGDGMLAEFPSVVDAVRCAVEIQRAMIDRNTDIADDRCIKFRVGINLGDVIVEEDDIYGDGVNIAARLEGLADAGGICISRTVRDQIRDKLPYPFEDIGEQSVKNIARPVRAYAMSAGFDTDRANLTEAQDEITGRLARTLNLELMELAAIRVEQDKTVDPDARDLVMRGWALFHRPHSAANRQAAQRAFERALETDPRSVDAKTGIATVLIANVGDAWSSAVKQDKERAEQFLTEALERNTNSSSAHFAMGQLRRLQNRLAESKIELETAISLDRNHARALRQLGMTLMYLGQPDAGIPRIEKAIRLNPHDPNMGNYYLPLGLCHLFLGHADQAIDLLRKARAANPRLYYLHLHLAGALGFRGDLDEAKTALAEGIKLKPEIDSVVAWRALFPWGNPRYWALVETTLEAGLRAAGLPD
jgi:class 3 adenylate cyclase/tetratricopeptide (TPR) repeat protein